MLEMTTEARDMIARHVAQTSRSAEPDKILSVWDRPVRSGVGWAVLVIVMAGIVGGAALRHQSDAEVVLGAEPAAVER